MTYEGLQFSNRSSAAVADGWFKRRTSFRRMHEDAGTGRTLAS
jgi:hypothetical protein